MNIPLTDDDLRDWARDEAWPSAVMAQELLALRGHLRRLRELHQPYETWGGTCCTICSTERWPCRTTRAMAA
jgi:hypothetical protein